MSYSRQYEPTPNVIRYETPRQKRRKMAKAQAEINKALERDIRMTPYFHECGGLTQKDRAVIDLKLSARLREYLKADILNPEREYMPPAMVFTYTNILKNMATLEREAFEVLEMPDKRVIFMERTPTHQEILELHALNIEYNKTDFA